MRPVLRRSSLLVATALGLAVACHAAAAQASPESDADGLIARGIELRQKEKDDQALALFKQALALAPTPRARAQVALAEQALGMWVAAESDLGLALAEAADPWIIKNRSALDGALSVVARHVGSLEVHGPEGAEVVLDGARLGTLPQSAPYRVEIGPRTLELRKPGFHTTARTLEIPAGGVARATISLAPLPTDAPASSPKKRPVRAARSTRRAEDPGRAQRVLGWTSGAAGLALLATGGIALGERASIVSDYNGSTCPGLGAPNQPGSCGEKVDDAHTWATVSVVSFIAGGVLTLGGATLLLTAPSRATQAHAASCAPTFAPGFSCVVTF